MNGRSRRGGRRGQATVELVLVLPVVALVLLAVVQVALVARHQLVLDHAAREGARVAAVGVPAGDVVARVRRVAGDDVAVEVDEVDGGLVRVRVTAAAGPPVALVGWALAGRSQHAEVTMWREEP